MTSLIDDTDQDDQIQIDENTDFLAQLTGPGGKFDRSKYSSDEDMYKAIAKGKVFSDATIELQNRRADQDREEQRKLREELMAGSSFKEMLNQMQALRQSNPRDNTPYADNENKGTVNPDEIESRIFSKLEAREQQRIQDANFKKVQDKLIETFGTRYQKPLQEHIADSGLNIEDIDTLARKSPTAAIKLLGLDQAKQDDGFEAPMKSNQRSSFSPKGAEKRTWAWYQRLRQTDRKTYDDPKTQTQMFQDSVNLGPEFRDGNFYERLKT